MGIRPLLLLVFCASLVLAANSFSFSKTKYPPGAVAPREPFQGNPMRHDHWKVDDYLFTDLAEYEITARVVTTSTYWMGREADLSPLDIGVVWGDLSDQRVLDKVRFTTSFRFMNFYFDGSPPLPFSYLSSHGANIHIIPDTRSTARDLKKIGIGDIIQLSGSLVKIESADGWHWESSLRRDDTGAGACEVMWVTGAKILKRPSLR